MNNHPLYKRVLSIAANNAGDGVIRHSSFERIRNQSSVRAILADMGYKPNCATKPEVWKHKSVKPEKKHVVLSVRQRLMNDITDGITVHVKDVELPNPKIINAISTLRSRGFVIEAIRDEEGRKVAAYRLINKQ